ncbi:hypothetical protein JI739_13210 [Ramlibacter sp. AW1]|uniref:Uncharacterized protein n=1 Tax=Ramlibacter aurantiacus TaxID=2801330 RepID=A0A937D5G8_9BURK|nr:hypothetical protein [Ramlibacter aurantiacus]MBL0421312.1 hypothetical protein [Ramlibacter aurantiacus]
MSTPAPHPPSCEPLAVEAARFALLRRIAFAIRHELMAHLQPVAMAGEIVERRLRAPEPNLDQIRDGVTRMTGLSRTASQACRDVIGWFAPEPGRVVPLQSAVDEATALLGSSLGFRGFSLRSELRGADWPVQRAAWRHLLPACLLLLSDEAGPPAEITLHGEPDGGQVLLRLTLEPTDGGELDAGEMPYRPLSADEVQALAQADGVRFTRQGDTIELRAPLAPTDTAA